MHDCAFLHIMQIISFTTKIHNNKFFWGFTLSLFLTMRTINLHFKTVNFPVSCSEKHWCAICMYWYWCSLLGAKCSVTVIAGNAAISTNRSGHYTFYFFVYYPRNITEFASWNIEIYIYIYTVYIISAYMQMIDAHGQSNFL